MTKSISFGLVISMFEKVFIEAGLKNHAKTIHILNKIKYKELAYLESYDDVWGKVKKPYLQKRTNLNLFIAKKKGQKVKEAPAAYGHGSEKHFYFIHSYNCIYECEYCYLQGYFNSPDIVFFINHDEIISEMQEIANKYPNAWFHAGEFSDSLALSHISDELALYHKFFKENPKNKLELRTKSVNLKPLLTLPPLENIITSFTLSSKRAGEHFDVRCPSVKHRLKAIKTLVEHGNQIGIHLDPMIFSDSFVSDYEDLVKELSRILPNESLDYISLGVVRFTKDVFQEVEKNYPESPISKQDYSKSFDGKIRYNLPHRMWMLNKVKEILIPHYDSEKIYFCMED